MHTLTRAVAACILLVSLPAFPDQPKTGHLQAVKDFIAAFNAHDSNAMSKLVTDDVQWLSVDAATLSVETNGKSALVAAMNDYFKSCPTCQSSLADMIATHDRVSAIEVASWHGKNGPQEQRGLSVYEFADGLIKRVYYFPAEK